MAKTLYICEKPSQARDIAAVLGINDKQDGYIDGNNISVTWCLGHLLELAPPDDYCENLKPWRMDVLPVLPKEWRLIPNKKTKSQLNVIKKLLKDVEMVIISTDADREGDVIGREVLDYFNYQGNIKRLWLSALDETSIKKALSEMREGESTYPLYQAGLGRQRADWAIGMNMTMATSCLFGTPGQGVLSVGRVQTPTLGLIVARDLEIENFKPKDYFDLRVLFHAEEGDFFTKWQIPEECSDEDGRCLRQELAEAVINKIKGQSGLIKEFGDKTKKTSAPTCFSLSSLQKLCSSKFGFTAKQTLKIAQSLYEKHKATTYPRTDSGYLPEDQFSEATTVLSALVKIDNKIQEIVASCDATYKSPTWNNSKVTAHHGIIPTTNTKVVLDNMSFEEKQVYDVIRRYYIAQFMGNYEYKQRKVIVLCCDETFAASCNIPVVLGWKQAINKDMEETDDNEPEEESAIPLLKQGASVIEKESDISTKQTKPSARFTEGTLIAAMKNIAKFVEDSNLKKILRDTSGIGTEATRADIIEKLINRGFVERKKKQLISTSRGRALIEIVPDQMKNPGTTAVWEQTLDDIANNSANLNDFLLDQEDILDFMLEDLKDIHQKNGTKFNSSDETYPCPKCKSPMARRKGKNGYFWGCTKYPNCNGIMQDKSGKPHLAQKAETSNIDCPVCHEGKLIKRKGKKGYWWGCSAYPTCKATFFDKKGQPDLTTSNKEK